MSMQAHEVLQLSHPIAGAGVALLCGMPEYAASRSTTSHHASAQLHGPMLTLVFLVPGLLLPT